MECGGRASAQRPSKAGRGAGLASIVGLLRSAGHDKKGIDSDAFMTTTNEWVALRHPLRWVLPAREAGGVLRRSLAARYSCRSASIGSSRAARLAGK